MSTISPESAPNHCRTCLQNLAATEVDEERRWNLQQSPELKDWLQELTQLETLDHYPQFVCTQCYTKLKSYHEFRELVQSAATVFEALYNNQSPGTILIKEEGVDEELMSFSETGERLNRPNKRTADMEAFTLKFEADNSDLTLRTEGEEESDDDDDDVMPVAQQLKMTNSRHRVANKRKSDDGGYAYRTSCPTLVNALNSFSNSGSGEVQSLRELLVKWDLSEDGIQALVECKITSTNLFKMITPPDIDFIFNRRDLLADRIKFRFYLPKWQVNPSYVFSFAPNPIAANPIAPNAIVPNSITPNTLDKVTLRPAGDFNVEDILKRSIMGESILAKKNHILNASDQSTIVRNIVDHFQCKNIKMTPIVMKTLAEEIKKIFPYEDEHTYYIPRSKGKKTPSGKIFDRYFNVGYKRKKLAEPKVIEKTTEPTSNDNREERPSFLTVWPKYNVVNGDQLINIDFGVLYPEKQNRLYDIIGQLEKKFNAIFFPDSIKEKHCLEQYKQMLSPAISADSRYYYFFMLMHTVLLPPRLSSKNKPTIADAQKDMFVHLVSMSSFEQTVDKLKSVALANKLNQQPKVIVIGESPNRLAEFYVYLDDSRFKVTSLLHAIDLVIKLSIVSHVQYSQKSKYVWMFIQEYIYEIPSDAQISKIRNIISKMHNTDLT